MVAIKTLLLTFSHLLLCYAAYGDEIRSLLEFSKGIKSDPSNKISSTWVPAADATPACPAAFYGVVCDPSSSSVIAIALDHLELSGDLKFNTLTNLKHLQNLTLAGNSLSGRLVPVLFTMSTLQVLDLSGNRFYGPIPDRLIDSWSLHHLDLSSNNFSGDIPIGIYNLQQLRVLDLHSNYLKGDVGELIPVLRNLERLDLSQNNFYGSIDLSVQNLSSLANTVQYVNISGNGLSGGFLGKDVMKMFRNLKVLDLGNNGIAGKLQDFGPLPNLQVLRLGNNQLLGSVPEGLLQGKVPLAELDLSGNQFEGSIPEINLTTLEVLNLSSNSISGRLPLSVGNCHILDLSRNLISGDISVLTTWNTNLEFLDLSSNLLTGIIPNLSQFESLIYLSLRNNTFDGNLPPALGSLAQLNTVDLSSNKLQGQIPISFFTSMSLANLNLSSNLLTGPVPIEDSRAGALQILSSSPRMESLDLSRNMLIGELPAAVGNWGRLGLLNLARNNLSGQLPDELKKLSVLEYLNLSYNGFSGGLPDNLPRSLKYFDVAYNKLSGNIPDNLYSFPDSSFSGNDLKPHHASASDDHVPMNIQNSGRHHVSGSSTKIAIILACVGAAAMIVFIVIAYRRARFHDFHVRRGFCGEAIGRDIKAGRFTRPSFFRFQSSSTELEQLPHQASDDHSLMASNLRSLSGRMDSTVQSPQNISPKGVATTPGRRSSPEVVATTSGRNSSPESPVLSSCRPREALDQPGMHDVCSPDRFAGELFFLDDSLMFTAEQLSRAPAEVLGRSSHGTLYKATLENGSMLTVKWLRIGLVKRKKEFAREVRKLGSLRHENIVPLRAYYWGPREQERLILADHIAGDSLAVHLYGTTPRRHPLSFTQRLNIARDVARGLMYLHEQGLPHGNLKPSNVLLAGSDYTICLTDFALHRLMTTAGVAEQVLNLGALGYCAPELASHTKPAPSSKADVYAFGVILMELLTGRSAGDIISGQSGSVDLTDWVRNCDREGRRLDCIDRDIAGEEETMDEAVGVSLRCIRAASERPNIRQVFQDICTMCM